MNYTYCNCKQINKSRHTQPYSLVVAKDGICTLCDHYVVTVKQQIESSKLIDGVKTTRAIGVYKNTVETSFVILPNGQEEMKSVIDFAFKNFDQESILYQNTLGDSYLIYNKDSESKYLGKLRLTSKVIAQQLDNYTIMGDNYYSIVK